MNDDSVLPANRSALERALERAFTELLYSSDNPYPSLKNPEKTPTHILPHLAQDRGVSEWDANAPISEQRRTVANAWPVRRLAGTRKGLLLAMDSLEHDAEVVPWYRMEPRGEPYHFELIAWTRANAPINQAVVSRMIDHLEGAKSERDTYELILALGNQSSIKCSGAVDPGVTIFDEQYGGEISGSPMISGHIVCAGALNQVLVTDDEAVGVLPARAHGVAWVSIAGACRAYTLTEFSPRARV